jgi:DNA-binding response OmpR family regulator
MYSPPIVVDMDIHSLRDKLDQGLSRPLKKTVRGVGYKIEA